MYRTILTFLPSVLISSSVSLRTVTSIGAGAFYGKYPDLVEWAAVLYCTVCMLGGYPRWLRYALLLSYIVRSWWD